MIRIQIMGIRVLRAAGSVGTLRPSLFGRLQLAGDRGDGTMYPAASHSVRMDIHHTAIRVGDLDATKAFYEDGLGLEYSDDFYTDEGVHNYYVTGERLDTTIQFVHDPDENSDVDPSGIVHLAIVVENTDEIFDRVVDRTDCPIVGEPTTIEAVNARAAFVEDPDGYEVELFSRLE